MKQIEKNAQKLKLAAIFALLFAASAAAKPTRPLSERVLIVGDSHLNELLGTAIYKELVDKNGLTVGMGSSCGSWGKHWVDGDKTKCGFVSRGFVGTDQSNGMVRATPPLRSLIKRHQPKLVVISLGSNYIGYEKHAVESYTKKLLGYVERSGARCVWVGPPRTCFDYDGTGLSRDKVNEALHATVSGRCAWVELSDDTVYPGYPACKRKRGDPDGTHYDYKRPEFDKIRAIWQKLVVDTILANMKKRP